MPAAFAKASAFQIFIPQEASVPADAGEKKGPVNRQKSQDIQLAPASRDLAGPGLIAIGGPSGSGWPLPQANGPRHSAGAILPERCVEMLRAEPRRKPEARCARRIANRWPPRGSAPHRGCGSCNWRWRHKVAKRFRLPGRESFGVHRADIGIGEQAEEFQTFRGTHGSAKSRIVSGSKMSRRTDWRTWPNVRESESGRGLGVLGLRAQPGEYFSSA